MATHHRQALFVECRYGRQVALQPDHHLARNLIKVHRISHKTMVYIGGCRPKMPLQASGIGIVFEYIGEIHTMFNLLVISMPFTAQRGWCSLGFDRIFGHTDIGMTTLFKPGGVMNLAAIMQLPTIFANETNNYDPSNPSIARIGRITNIRPGAGEYQIEYSLDADIPPIPNAVLESLAAELDFKMKTRSFNEFQTNHWAVKDVDLFQVLYKHGIGRGIKPTVFKLTADPIDPSLVAVMMPFDEKFNAVYATFQTAIAAVGMKCQRADDVWDNDHVIQDVVSLIERAAVVICDLTGRNSNVFYEMGIAHTLGRNVIMVTQSAEHVPFDVGHIRNIRYLNNAEGLAKLANDVTDRLLTLRARIGV